MLALNICNINLVAHLDSKLIMCRTCSTHVPQRESHKYPCRPSNFLCYVPFQLVQSPICRFRNPVLVHCIAPFLCQLATGTNRWKFLLWETLVVTSGLRHSEGKECFRWTDFIWLVTKLSQYRTWCPLHFLLSLYSYNQIH